MADIAIFRINYKSDFILTLNSDAGWMTPFCIKFWTGAPSQAYFASFDGTTYTHCAPVSGDPTKLLVQFDDHHLPIGDLQFQIAYHFTVADFPTSVEDEVINQSSVIIEVDDAPAQVMLDLNGETAPEIEFSLPAYANEAQRIANEEQRIAAEAIRIVNEESRIAAETIRQQNEAQRISNEESRVADFAQMKQESETATADANAAATLANEKAQLAADKSALADDAATLANAKAQLAADKAALADDAATLANDKAALAQQKAEYAQTQGDYAKAQGNYAKEQGEIAEEDHERAESDHTRAESDHATAGSDHTQAATDHTRAESDHTTAANDHTRADGDHSTASADHTTATNDHAQAVTDHTTATSDHTQAGNDHTRAESDHTRAESDHASVEVYVDSLGAFDISAYHNNTPYIDLAAALGNGGANIPEPLRKGGMSVKFIQGESAQSSDNKYVQYRLMSNTFNTTVANWQGVESEPKSGSQNLVNSGGIKKSIYDVSKNFGLLFEEKSISNKTGYGTYFDLSLKSGVKYTIKRQSTSGQLQLYYAAKSGSTYTRGDSIGTILNNATSLNFTLSSDTDAICIWCQNDGNTNVSIVNSAILPETLETALRNLKVYSENNVGRIDSLTKKDLYNASYTGIKYIDVSVIAGIEYTVNLTGFTAGQFRIYAANKDENGHYTTPGDLVLLSANSGTSTKVFTPSNSYNALYLWGNSSTVLSGVEILNIKTSNVGLSELLGICKHWLNGRHLVCLGDSLSRTSAWQTPLAEKTGAIYSKAMNDGRYSFGGTKTLDASEHCAQGRAALLVDDVSNNRIAEPNVIILENVNDGSSLVGTNTDESFFRKVQTVITPSTTLQSETEANNYWENNFASIVNSETPAVGTILQVPFKSSNGIKLTITSAPSAAGRLGIQLSGTGELMEYVAINANDSIQDVLDKILEYDWNNYNDEQSGADSVIFTKKNGSSATLTVDVGTTGIVYSITDGQEGTLTVDKYFYGHDTSKWTDSSYWKNEISLWSAYKGLIEYLQTAFPEAYIYYMFPKTWNVDYDHLSAAQKYADGSVNYDYIVTNNQFGTALFDVQKAFCERYQIPYLDLRVESCLTPYNLSEFMNSANIHPKSAGFARWADVLVKLLG